MARVYGIGSRNGEPESIDMHTTHTYRCRYTYIHTRVCITFMYSSMRECMRMCIIDSMATSAAASAAQ